MSEKPFNINQAKSEINKLSFQELESQRENNRGYLPFSIWLHDVRSVFNVGSVFRSCDGSSAERLYLSGFSPTPPRQDLSKTALGAEETVPYTYLRDFKEIISQIKAEGKKIIAMELTDNSIDFSDLKDSDYPAVFLLGNEVGGLPSELLEMCDSAVSLPMLGKKHSLNVSVTAGIICYKSVEILQKGI
ncbi:MAG: RNA methyltransferase [Candidatus Kapaibacteriales bacterium]